MAVFFTADLHFNHASILRHCRRPWDVDKVEGMNEQLVENWNGMVGRKDTIYILGDFAWKDHRRFINRLHGKKILVVGNHDKMDQLSYQQFSEVVGGPRQPGILIAAIEKRMVVLSHFRLHTWPSSNYGSWHLYGHSHGRLKEEDYRLCCDVGVDIWGYTPVPWEVIKLKMESKELLFYEQRKQMASSRIDDGEADSNVVQLRAVNIEWRNLYSNARGGSLERMDGGQS